DGNAANGAFKGILKIKDPNLDLDFDGDFVMVEDSNRFDFQASVNYWDLFATHFTDDSISVVTTRMDVDFTGKDLSNYSGNIHIEEATYETGMRFYFFNEILIRNRLAGEERELKVESELLSARLSGQYNLVELSDVMEQYFQTQFLKPDEAPKYARSMTKMDYDLRVDLNNTELLTEIFLPKLYIEPNTVITSHFNSANLSFDANVVSPGFSYGANQFRAFTIGLKGQEKKFTYRADFEPFNLANRIEGDSILLTGAIYNDSIRYDLTTLLKDSINTFYRMEGSVVLDPDKVTVGIDRGNFNIGLDQFSYPAHDRIVFYGDSIEFDHFSIIQNDRGELNIDGLVGNSDKKLLRVEFKDFGLSLFSYLIRDPSANFRGSLTGDLTLRSLMEEVRFSSDLVVDSLSFNKEHQGDFYIQTEWASGSDLIQTSIRSQRGELKTLEFVGTVDPKNDFALDLKARFDRFRIKPFNPFIDFVFSNLRGAVSGEISVVGTAFKPIAKGELAMNNVGFTVGYIGTDYNFEGVPSVSFDENIIRFPNIRVRDTKNSSSGTVSGSIRHDHFSDLELDVHVKANSLLCLDLEQGDNEYFYGTAYGTGNVDIIGPTENITINVDATTNKGTDLKIPLTNPTEVVEKGFITFVTADGEIPGSKNERALVDLGLSGLSLNLNIAVTPEARVELIMDETVGDVISGSAEGNIRISIPPSGEMEMYGSLEVTRGEYLFTLQNLINKPFSIQSGGTITWTGDPYKARMDLVARYTTRTSLNGVVRNPDYNNERFTVNLDLSLQGQLLNPNINFDISVPGAPPAIQEELRSALNDQNKLNYQAFSLLAFNTFAPDNEAAANSLVGYGVQSNGMQMVVSQFSNFLNQGLNGVVDIQLGYNQGGIPNSTTGVTSQEQLEVGVSKSFIDDRLVVNGVFDVPVGSNPNALVGDVEVEYKITPNVRAKAFNRSNQDNPALDKLAPYTQGVGIFYRTDFNTFDELVRKIFGIKEDPESEPQPEDNGTSPSDSTTTSN
ncbi:MAG: translocation/assembly module TamB domain-containing protein, partial [Bacteroidota bacterium]|nr:translocation/assembly module TamB domain-containing protein [Bacteroidota bacterium]